MNNKTRVLLVEDEELARETLDFYLNTIFDEVVLACDGQEAVDIFKENHENNKHFDLVLTDLQMPNKDGMNMIKEMLNYVADQRFIIVSAHKNNEDLLTLINLRVLGYFVKPLNVDDMMHMLKKAKAEVLEDRKESQKDESLLVLNDRFTFNKKNKNLYLDNNLLKLSKRELDILNVLIENIGEVLSIEDFKIKIWEDETVSDSAFRTNMKRLKDKISENDFILSQKGFGYSIQKPLNS